MARTAVDRWRRRPDRRDRETLARLEELLRRAGRRPLRLDIGPRLARLQELRRARAGGADNDTPPGPAPGTAPARPAEENDE